MLIKNFVLDFKCFTEFSEICQSNDADSRIVSFCNPVTVEILRNRPLLYDQVDYWFSDGVLMTFLSGVVYGHHVRRCSFDFTSVAGLVMEYAILGEHKVGFIGGSEDEIEAFKLNIGKRYPQLNVGLAEHGFHCRDQWSDLLHKVQASGINVLIVGLGCPLQEEFAVFIKSEIQQGMSIFTCGGFITQTSLAIDYYPLWVRHTGLRWLYRAIMHKHVRRRLLFTYPNFILRLLRERLSL